MKKFDEMVAKMHSHYVADDYIQIMLAYRDYLLLFGNNDLMYFKNFIASHPSIREGSKNVYLDDERKNNFPYSQIPEHIERVLLFRKLNFVNQILDFEKPYIRINDGFITKMTAFKDGDEYPLFLAVLAPDTNFLTYFLRPYLSEPVFTELGKFDEPVVSSKYHHTAS